MEKWTEKENGTGTEKGTENGTGTEKGTEIGMGTEKGTERCGNERIKVTLLVVSLLYYFLLPILFKKFYLKFLFKSINININLCFRK